MARKERQKSTQGQNSGLILNDVKPITMTQSKIFKEFYHGNNLVLYGVPGSGKTFVAVALALAAIERGQYRKLVIYRSTVPSRDMGFLPGSADAKAAVYEAPYEGICAELYGRADAWGILKLRKVVEFKSTAFIRGITESNCIVLVDEAQNCAFRELNTIATRMGDNSRLIVSGDMGQQDYLGADDSGLPKFMRILQMLNNVSFIEMQIEDIVRSGFVKDYMIASYNYEKKKYGPDIKLKSLEAA